MADSDWKDDPHQESEWVDDKPLDNKYSATQSAIMHGLNQATGGFSDEIQGLGEAAGRVVGVHGAGGPMKDMGLAKGGPTIDWETLRDAYKAARDHERQALKQQSEEHPIASGAGDLVGMVGSPINKIAKGASLATSGMAIGGVNALGSSDAEDVGGMAKDTAIGVGLGGALGKGIEKASPYLEKGVSKVASGLNSAGRSIYKSGLKRIDQEVAKYGKEPVSDLLMKHGITGDAQQIFDKMSALGDNLLAERNAILKHATRAGAEVDVPASLKDAQIFVDNLKNIDNPEMKQAVKMLQGRIDTYMGSAAKESEQILRELPTSDLKPEFREIRGYRPASDELVKLPSPKPMQEANFQNELKGYDAPTLSNPGHGSDSWSGQDLLHKIAGDNSRFKKITSEPVLRNSFDEIIGLPQGAKYETKYAPGFDTGLRQHAPEVIYGREVPAKYIPGKAATVFDSTDRVPGPSPIQASSWKTTSANNVGDANWEQLSRSAQGKGFDKALSGGLRRGTEDSVERVLGADVAADLTQKNTELGQILTSKERALLDAQQEGRKNAFTSVDGMLSTNPAILAMKKIADISKTTQARTVGGKSIMDASQYLMRSPKLAELAQKNPQAFNALVGDFARKVNPGGTFSKAASQEPIDEDEAKKQFVDGN